MSSTGKADSVSSPRSTRSNKKRPVERAFSDYAFVQIDTSDEDEQMFEERHQRTLSFLGRNLNVPRNSICGGGTVHSLQSSLRSGEISRKNTKVLLENPNLFARALSEKVSGLWIEHAFEKRECIKFIAQQLEQQRCGCGRQLAAHTQLAQSRFSIHPNINRNNNEQWSIQTHTQVSPTDAHGTIVFQGGAHAHKAQYVRLGYDSNPADVMNLMKEFWGLEPPKLVITVHGGMSNFTVQEKLGRLFREGLLKAAKTTGAWILTGGLDSGVVKHVAQALDEAGISARMRSRIVTIGIAPWGVIKKRERLIAKDGQISYDSHSFASSNGRGILNDRHSYFLLADNGTSGRYGADLHLRQAFENYLAEMALGGGNRKIPVVCALLEGGTYSIKAVHQYVTKAPDIPVIVCEGSGRASDVLSVAARYIQDDGVFPAEARGELCSLINKALTDLTQSPEQILDMVIECAQRTDLLTIFRFGEERQEDVDHAILKAVLKGQNLSLTDQLGLTLSWNRVDVARSCLFSGGKNWPLHALHQAMNEALRLDRVEFVELLLENGVSMKSFLTINTLEQLYNLDDQCPQLHSVRFLLDDFVQPSCAITLPDIGILVEKLMGSAYRHYYTSRTFKNNYEKFRKKAQLSRLSSFHIRLVSKNKHRKNDRNPIDTESLCDFTYPFNDLMIWAILTRRHQMAHCLWLHGEEAMAKALVAIRLNKAMAKVAEDDNLDVEVANELREHADEFRSECHQLLDFCYREDNEETLRLLTAELPHWSHHNCLSLAVLANNKSFLAHPCCQMLLAELWHGALRVRSGSNMRVVTALLCPPAALALAFKTSRITTVERNESDTESHIDDKDSHYDTLSSYRTEPADSNSHVGSVMSMHISRLFKPRPPKCRPSRSGELEELMENGNGLLSPPKKVTILSSKKNSAVIYNSTTSINSEPPPTLTRSAKIRAFYSAPITKFWSWCLAFHIFLMMQTYVLLIDLPVEPTKIEWATLVYILVFAIEHIRKFCAQETRKPWKKVQMFYSRYYNLLTLIALVLFLAGFALRLQPTKRHSYGRVMLSCSNVLFYMKVLEFLSVHPLLGPYIQMAAKMVISMCYIIVLLLVTLMAFGVSRQSITYPHEKWNWLLVRNIFYKPYFMLYGEVYAGEIDTCGDEAWGSFRANGTAMGTNCVPGGWIPPVLMTVFLLVANILLINMLIAIFNNIFNEANDRSKEVWLFQRYDQIMEYNDTPLLPPPLTIIAHLIRIVNRCCCKGNKGNSKMKTYLDYPMKLNLSPEELRVLHDFEEDCMDELTRKRISKVKGTPEERWAQTMEHTEMMSQHVQELLHENIALRNRLCDMDSRITWISRCQTDLLRAVKVIPRKKSQFSSRGSSQSLPDAGESIRISPMKNSEMQMLAENVLLSVEDRNIATSPLISHLRRDHILRKYDEARYQPPQLKTKRARLNSSSLSISQDMREMNRSKNDYQLQTSEDGEDDYDDDIPSVYIQNDWDNASTQPQS